MALSRKNAERMLYAMTIFFLVYGVLAWWRATGSFSFPAEVKVTIAFVAAMLIAFYLKLRGDLERIEKILIRC